MCESHCFHQKRQKRERPSKTRPPVDSPVDSGWHVRITPWCGRTITTWLLKAVEGLLPAKGRGMGQHHGVVGGPSAHDFGVPKKMPKKPGDSCMAKLLHIQRMVKLHVCESAWGTRSNEQGPPRSHFHPEDHLVNTKDPILSNCGPCSDFNQFKHHELVDWFLAYRHH